MIFVLISIVMIRPGHCFVHVMTTLFLGDMQILFWSDHSFLSKNKIYYSEIWVYKLIDCLWDGSQESNQHKNVIMNSRNLSPVDFHYNVVISPGG